MKIFEEFLSQTQVNQILNSDKIEIAESCEGFNQFLIASDFYKGDDTVFVVLPNLYQAQKYYDALTTIVDEKDVLFFPADELMTVEMISATGDFVYERIQTIYTLLDGEKKIVITNMHGAIKYERSPDVWGNSFFVVERNDFYNIKELCNKLVSLGYEPTFTTVKTGQFSKRGSIIDIFPLGYDNPIRLDFFDEEVETIKEFNIENQRSIKEVYRVLILPVTEFIYDEDEYYIAKSKILSFLDSQELSSIEESMYKKDLDDLKAHVNLDSLMKYISFFDDEKATIFDFVENKRVYIVDDYRCKTDYDRLLMDLNDYCGRVGGYSLAKMPFFKNYNFISSEGNVFINGLKGISFNAYNVYAKDIVPYRANQKAIVQDFKDFRHKKKLIIAINDEKRYKKFEELLDENNIRINPITSFNQATLGYINVIKGNYPAFDMQYGEYMIVNEQAIFDDEAKPKKAKYKSIYKNAIKISRYDELVIGDYVVHYEYGVGKYLGIQTKKIGEIERDYIHVMYAKNAALLIPLEQLSKLMKYASADVEGVLIHEIGGTAWAKAKARVKKRVRDISDKLIAIYSERQKNNGFDCPIDTPEQYDFESDFEYDLTQDQQKAIEDVKSDMESKRPMDRLICGDVGYGKTEVAMRAAFKMVYSGGKQVCVLAPTTILARQHYNTFKRRMEPYGIRVEMLSRFVSKKDQTKIIEDLKKGGVDVVVGTHRVLSEEIKYKELGLLIVDEEQRFGVGHKEKIKELKTNVDCITLSATPIPRTLQMSVMGIKDLSMIETPPKNRYPIQTYVIERNDRIIADSIERELARGGQVFYLYNWTETIEEYATKLQNLVPDAKVCIGHGKMTKDKLEDVISKFINKEYNVLLCTTIIETGIDMPDANTLLIHDADRLGLSQMYQIRGRVGRSNKIAYAYLMYEPRKTLTPEAEKRLATIKEFNELGSGFKIAMRDLSIRGAGDLLGEEQSGFVESVGIDMYLKILDEEVNKKEEDTSTKPDASLITPLTNRTINKNYINNDDIRISIHKRIANLKSITELVDLKLELKDRFGSVDNELEMYMYEKLMFKYCEMLGVYKIDKSKRSIWEFYLNKESSKNIDSTKLYQNAFKTEYTNIHYDGIEREYHIIISLANKSKLQCFIDACQFFSTIV